MPSLKFGFLGAGQIAHCSVPEVNSHPEATVVAAQDINAERLQELCKAQRIPKAYATAEELLADPEIDAVYIALPNKFHVPLTIQALEAGKHVILEKPFAMNYAEAKRAAETARRMGKVLNLGMNQRFAGNPQRVKALVEQNKLGEVYHAKAYWMRRTGIPKLGTWFSSRELAGGGALYDIGVHVLDLCLYLLGNFEPVAVSGATYTKFGHLGLGEGGWGRSDRSDLAFDVDDFATGWIRFANGATVSLDATWARHAEESDRADVELFGTQGGASAYKGRFYHQDEASGEYVIRENLNVPVRYGHGSRFHNFINHLLGTEELCATLDQSLVVQKVLDALAASSACGKEIRLDTPEWA